MTFRLVPRARAVRRMVSMWPESGFGRLPIFGKLSVFGKLPVFGAGHVR